ncbi:MAG: FHA domain-containing protein [Acidobacteria bacterium]|nr:FHA domain-containing protein [Acidobacteriota bacterium]
MIVCVSCGKSSLDGSRFCSECGARLMSTSAPMPESPAPVVFHNSNPDIRPANVTSVDMPQMVEVISPPAEVISAPNAPTIDEMLPEPEVSARGEKGPEPPHSRLVVERGAAANTEFPLTAEESYIGRWDADNGIFPDVDLDPYDTDAKVSRKHARIIRGSSTFMIEDLGSTNGTFINRGRRLLPGSPQVLNDGDEIIVGKTFLRFYRNN